MSQGQRRLAAIMFTDMVGYTKVSQSDEGRAISLLDDQRGIVRELLQQYGGREVKTIGDAFLVEFSSSLSAVNCAVAIQESVRRRNSEQPVENQISLRVGVHLGEVLERNGDIYGDAVNVASRIEPLAPPGGICVSRQVHEMVSNKSNLMFKSLGRRELKNVPEPLEVYSLVMSWEDRSGQRMQSAVPADRVAVLPFVNISPVPNDEYFADGLTEELITRLSQVGGLKVIARTSVMNYKKKEMNASEIGAALGAGTLVEGSVRKAGARIRVSVQVIDSNTEEHRWSTNYDRNLDDIFAVQSEIASRVTESLPGSIMKLPAQRDLSGTENIEAYTAFLRARELIREPGEASIRGALAVFQDAVDLDPSFARAYVGLAGAYAKLVTEGYEPREEFEPPARAALAKALEISPDLAEAHAQACLFAWFDDDFATAEAEGRKAIELNPNLADAYSNLALLVSSAGDLSESIRLLEKARELNPLSSEVSFLGQLYFYSGREAEALEIYRKLEVTNPVACCSRMGEYELTKGSLDSAKVHLAKLEKLAPDRVGVVGLRGMVAAAGGDEEQARKVIARLKEEFRDVNAMPNYVAYVYYMLGDLDETFGWLEKAVDAHSLIPHVIRYSPLFARLRSDPRYQKVLVRNGLNPENKSVG